MAFICNKFWVFGSTSVERGVVSREAITFFAERALTGVLAIVVFYLLYNAGIDQFIFGLDGFFAKMLTTFMEIALNFIISKYYVFTAQRRDAQ